MDYNQQILDEQRQFLEDLIAFQEPIKNLEKRDKIGFVWDDQPEGYYFATLTRQNIISILQRFLSHDITAKDVYDWSDEFVARDGVNKEPGYQQVIINALSELSTDYDHGLHFTTIRAQELIHELQTAQFDPEDV